MCGSVSLTVSMNYNKVKNFFNPVIYECQIV